jgi:hypothetical protein
LLILAVSIYTSPLYLVAFIEAISAAGYPPPKVIDQNFIGDFLLSTDIASIRLLGGIGVFTVDQQVSVSLYLLHSVFPLAIFANILSFDGWGLLLRAK